MTVPKSADMLPGFIFHDGDHSEWMVVGTERDYLTGTDAFRIVQLAKGEAYRLKNEKGEWMAEMPFSGRVARLYPKTVGRFHVKETE